MHQEMPLVRTGHEFPDEVLVQIVRDEAEPIAGYDSLSFTFGFAKVS
jgi:hypothetical protein